MAGFGSLSSLVKLQASFNRFTHLPADLLRLPRLELMRVAVCQLEHLPPALHHGAHGGDPTVLPRLAWFSLGGNVACGAPPAARCRGAGGAGRGAAPRPCETNA